MRVVVVDPQEVYASGPEEPLWYVSPYMQKLAERIGAELLSLSEATREGVHGARADAVLGAGHGLPDRWLGYRGDVLFQLGDPVPSPRMLVLACYTALRLGPYAYGRGAEYLGWTQEFVFPVEVGRRGGAEAYLLDPVAEAFSTLDPARAAARLFNAYTALLLSDAPLLVKAMAKYDRDTMASYAGLLKLAEPVRPTPLMLAGVAPLAAVTAYAVARAWTP
jgi:hypothetical protein